MRVCSIEGCGRRHSAKGLCYTHRSRQRSTGDPQAHVPILTSGARAAERNRERALPVGSTRFDPNGYVIEKIGRDHPFAAMANMTHGAWVQQHRLIMAEGLGRALTPAETVHHKNGLRDDNRLENLELWEGRHGAGQRAVDPHCLTCTCRKTP